MPIRKRFDDKTIQALLNLQWWNWNIKKITQHAKDIATGNMRVLIL